MQEHGLLRYYRAPLDVTHGIFTRQGGVSSAPFASLNLGSTVGDDPQAVRENHRLVYEALGVDGQRACTTWLVHSAEVAVATGPHPERGWLTQADGLITNVVGLPLVMRYADCTPILYYDPVQRVVGLAHAGWRGTVQGVARRTVQAMNEAYGTRPEDVQAVIGPSISQAHFQVGEEVVEAMHAYFGPSAAEMIWRCPDDGSAYVDLWEANRRDLQAAGVRDITVMGLCTVDQVADFYSHRAEKGRTGRFGVVICL
ncbi:MAG: peptidoglycan editing factor PgeF [Anaerolineae bacterium]|nr:peptidoglycan editing factor PgeF [Anaerolineae bacterium]MDW8172425.1 peptidoglycan editing factor PgeF [Anaerolineae bacterium]